MKHLALSLLALAACSHDSHPADPTSAGGTAPAAVTKDTTTGNDASGGEIHTFKIGALDAVALKDGGMNMPNDGTMIGMGHDPKDLSAVLTKAGAPGDHIELSIQPLLVKDGAHVLLFDTGLADPEHGGRLPASLAMAGVAPAAITDIFISHSHPDHLGGLVTADGKLGFPNASVHMTTLEWKSMQANDKVKAITDAIAPKIVTFEPGAKILPEVTAVDTRGHTPGHSSYDISSNGEHLFYIGDVAHSWIISVQRPDWAIAFDGDPATAMQVRKQTLAKLAADKTRVYAVHFPFPGLGHITGSGDNLAFQPE